MSRWLSRALIRGPFLRLCLDERDFRAALRDIECQKPHPSFLGSAQADATTHLISSNRGLVAIVTLGDMTKRDLVEVYALLVHEAVHVWQALREDLGERDPSHEFEAYALQSIAGTLMQAYTERRGRKRVRK